MPGQVPGSRPMRIPATPTRCESYIFVIQKDIPLCAVLLGNLDFRGLPVLPKDFILLALILQIIDKTTA